MYQPLGFDSGSFTLFGTVNPSFVDVFETESVVYSGMGGNDTFTVAALGTDNAFTVTPGALGDAGTVQADLMLGVYFQSLGGTGKLVVDGGGGTDSLVYNGT